MGSASGSGSGSGSGSNSVCDDHPEVCVGGFAPVDPAGHKVILGPNGIQKVTTSSPTTSPSLSPTPITVEKIVKGEGTGTLLCMGFLCAVIIGLLAYIGIRKPETASKVDEGGRAFPVSAVIITLIIAVTVVIVVATMAEAAPADQAGHKLTAEPHGIQKAPVEKAGHKVAGRHGVQKVTTLSPTMGNPITEETKGKGDETSTLLCLGFFVVVIIGLVAKISMDKASTTDKVDEDVPLEDGTFADQIFAN